MPKFLVKEIRKRDGQITQFESDKINIVIKKAFFAVTNDPHEEKAKEITEAVIEALDNKIESAEGIYVPGVEDIQDLVEQNIMKEGFFDVAKAFIIFRFLHAKIRQEEKEEVIEKIEKRELLVKKRDGSTELFSVEKVKKAIENASVGFEESVNVDQLVRQCQSEVYDGIETADVGHVLVLCARSFIEKDPAYATVASRLLLHTVIYKDAIRHDFNNGERFQDVYKRSFVENINECVNLGILDKRMKNFDFEKLANGLKPERDDLLKYMGVQTLYDRYLVRDKENSSHHRFLETPQILWMRVAMGLSLNEARKEERALEFYEALSSLRFISSTPTLFNSGLTRPQLSSCFLNVVDDSLNSIFKTYSNNAQLSKWSGGIGTSWSKVRATGAYVENGGMYSNGVIPFLKIADSVTVAISRSGRRRGATVVYLETWHYDIESFLELRKNTGDDRRRTHDMNTANWIPDLFMKRVRDNSKWTLFSPDEVPELTEVYGREFEEHYIRYESLAREGKMKLTKEVNARELWKKMLTMLFETGHPWVTFKDPSNIRSPQDHVGVVHSSNLCTEITLNTSAEETAVCNLGSVNLSRHMKGKIFDEELVATTVKTGMRMLDNVIDVNFYPTREAWISNMRHRPVGLGLMGFQDALFMQGIRFDSDKAVSFADRSMEVISYNAILASSELARERGVYESYKGSKWERGIFPIDTIELLERERGEDIPLNRTESLDWSAVRQSVVRHGMRNSNTMAMAPTATISNIAGCFPTIEPIYKNIYVKANISGEFIVVNHYLVNDLKSTGLWNDEMLELIKGQDGDISAISSIPSWIKEKHREVFAMDPQWTVKAAAHRGKWIDQSQSLNIFYGGISGKVLSDIYLYAWQMGLKTTYYLRTLAASTVEKSTVSLDRQKVESSVSHSVEAAAAEAVANIKESIERETVNVPRSDGIISEVNSPRLGLSKNNPNPRKELGGQVLHSSKICKIEDPDCESCQ